MAKNKVSEWSSTAASNTDVGGIDIAEGCAPSGINNAIREMMAQVKDMQAGTDSDSLVVGGNLSVTGTTSLTGDATAPTQIVADNSTKIATTAFVQAKVGTLGTMATQNANNVAITGGTVAATFTGNLTGNTAGFHTGDVAGNVTGNVTGNLTGNVTGNVTGSSGSTAQLTTATGSAPSYSARAYANINAGTVVNITGSYSRTSPSTTVIVTTATAHPFRVGDTAYLNFTTGTALDGAYTIVSTSSNTNFTITTVASTTTAGNITVPTVDIRKAGNVSSVCASTVGTTASLYYVNFTTDMPDANYSATVTVSAGTVATTATSARTLTVDTGSNNVSIIGLAIFD